MQRNLAVLGSPISHSKSPLIQSAAYRVLGLEWNYDKIEVRPGGLRPFVESLDESWLGLSVTMPLKEEAAKFATSLDKAAEATGAANTLVRTEAGWLGYNTDVFGLVQAIHHGGLGELKDILVIGSGATATSAIAAISQLAPKAKVRVFARNPQTRDEVIEFGRSLGLSVKKVSNLPRAAKNADLTLATLPGGALNDWAAKLDKKRGFNPQGALLDVAYQPWPSELAAVWSSRGNTIISGLEMLIWQAVAQVRIFTSGDANQALPNEVAVVEAMRHSLD